MPNKIATKSTGLTVEQLKQSEITLRIVGTINFDLQFNVT